MKKFDEINIIPFLDIMLVLLAIVLVTVTESGELFYNDKPITKEALLAEVESWDKTQKVTLKVDAATAFQQFVDITDILSKYEIKNVAIVTLKPQGSE